MYYINTTYQATDCTVFGVSTQDTANDWAMSLSKGFPDEWFCISNETCRSLLANVAPHRYAEYRRYILFNPEPAGKRGPNIFVIAGGKE